MPRTAPYGTWESPITLERLVEDAVGLSFPLATSRHVYWTEARPSEGGRQALVRQPIDGGGREDVVPADFNVRTTVHEYGGLCVAVRPGAAEDAVYFSNFSDQRVYRLLAGQVPEPLTPEPPFPGAVRFGAPVLTPDGDHVVMVRETHGEPDLPSTVVNDVVILPTGGEAEPRLLLGGHDFYSHLGISPDGRRLCWVSWDHPNMPWDGTELWEGELDVAGAAVRSPRLVAGGPSESVTQPKYAADGTLHYVSDRTGWWNLYAATRGGGDDGALAPMDADFAVPDFQLGASSYALLADGSIVASWMQGGLSHLGVRRPDAAAFSVVDSGFTLVHHLRGSLDGTFAVAVAGSGPVPLSIVRVAPTASGSGPDERRPGAEVTVLRPSRREVVDPASLSLPQPVDFPTEGGAVAHALYYAPTNPDFAPPDGELPPLIVRVHGGPTSAALPVLNYTVQYWTSRGFALVDVNYGGSTGYGRAYRDRLRGQWGVVDLQDCVAAARHLEATGRADGRRLLIHGGSAGGYTTLCAAAFTDAFAAGASYFGVADTEVFVGETHKFESHYTDSLFGPWPETADVYRARSPVRHTERLRTPLIIFQGLEDKVVPPDQAEKIVAALDRNKVPYAYVTYEGEQHGFRKASSVRRTAEAELYFYGRILGFDPADVLEPVEIFHEDRSGS